MARRRKHVRGLVQYAGYGFLRVIRWTGRHPQPAAIAALLVGAAWGLWGYAQGADAFRITQVQLPSPSTLKLPAPLIGENLWTLDIRALARELHHQQPWLKEVRVVRQPPNTVWIETIPRVPVAQLQLRQWYPLDREGFILPQATAASSSGLPRLVGVERAPGSLKVGALNTNERLTTALRVLETLRRTPVLTAHQLTEVNVDDLQQIRFVIDGDMEVRCGTEEELSEQLERLRAVMKVIARKQLAVRYIDVRFKEAVIGPRI